MDIHPRFRSGSTAIGEYGSAWGPERWDSEDGRADALKSSLLTNTFASGRVISGLIAAVGVLNSREASQETMRWARSLARLTAEDEPRLTCVSNDGAVTVDTPIGRKTDRIAQQYGSFAKAMDHQEDQPWVWFTNDASPDTLAYLQPHLWGKASLVVVLSDDISRYSSHFLGQHMIHVQTTDKEVLPSQRFEVAHILCRSLASLIDSID